MTGNHGSYVGLMAVDQSVLLMGAGNDITIDKASNTTIKSVENA